MRRISKTRGILALAAMCALAALAQQTRKEKREAASERIVQGTVSSAGGKAINGAVVLLKDSRTLLVRSFITEQNGAYHFSGLKIDDDYQALRSALQPDDQRVEDAERLRHPQRAGHQPQNGQAR